MTSAGGVELAGATPVEISVFLPHDSKLHFVFGRFYAHCADCMKAAVETINQGLRLQRANE